MGCGFSRVYAVPSRVPDSKVQSGYVTRVAGQAKDAPIDVLWPWHLLARPAEAILGAPRPSYAIGQNPSSLCRARRLAGQLEHYSGRCLRRS